MRLYLVITQGELIKRIYFEIAHMRSITLQPPLALRNSLVDSREDTVHRTIWNTPKQKTDTLLKNNVHWNASKEIKRESRRHWCSETSTIQVTSKHVKMTADMPNGIMTKVFYVVEFWSPLNFIRQIHSTNLFRNRMSKFWFSKPLRKLPAFLDSSNVLRVKGRLKNAPIAEEIISDIITI